MMSVGIDEVGRGAWAGPLAVGVALGDERIAGHILRRRQTDSYYDSKALSPQRRRALHEQLQSAGLAFGVGYATALEIDTLGLTAALVVAAERGLVELERKTTATIGDHRLLLDGKHNYLQRSNVQMIVGGDRLHPLIGAASIAAKLARDAVMASLDQELPYWDFLASKGYGSKRHRFGLHWQGPSVEHRRSFRPVQALSAPLPTRFFSPQEAK